MKFTRKSKGVISVFLILILVPTMVLSAMLVDASRLRSARAMAQEASDLAVYSVLSAYDGKLKEMYGLLAFEDNEKLQSIMEESLKATLSASDLGVSAGYSEQVWEILKNAAGAGSDFQGKDFLNLYDFRVDHTEIKAMHNLANPAVLQNQIVEYSKYRGLYVIAERMNLLANLGAVSESAKKMEEAETAMKDKISVDEDNDGLEQEILKTRQAAENLNKELGKIILNQLKEEFFDSIGARMKLTQDEAEASEEEDYEEDEDNAELADKTDERIKALTEKYRLIAVNAEALDKATDCALKKLDAAEKSLNQYIASYTEKAAGNESVKLLVTDAEENLKRYREYRPKLEAIRDSTTKKNLVDAKLNEKVEKLLKDIKERSEDFQPDNKEEQVAEDGYGFRYLNSRKRTRDSTSVLIASREDGGYEATYDHLTAIAVNADKVPEFNPYEEENTDKDKQEQEEDQNDKKPEVEDTSHERRSVPTDIYNSRPSINYDYKEAEAAGYPTNDDKDLSGIKNVFNQDQSFLLNLAETTRDEALTMSYVFGTFKTRMTDNGKFIKGNAPDENKPYVADWRYMYEDGEHDMRFTAKKDRDTQLTAEIEYMVYGMQSDTANEAAVYATIWGSRMVNNMIALYTNIEVKGACRAAAWATAAAVTAATAGLGAIISPEVYFWIYLAAWAAVETTMDLTYLVDDGYYIPLFKTKDNILLTVDTGGVAKEDYSLIDNYNMSAENAGIASKIKVCYEDYLLLLLLFQSSDSRVMRIGDLVEMNMRKSDGGFRLNKADTYIQSSTDLSVRYLFSSDSVLGTEYKKSGIGDRMKFNSTIYLGY